MTSEDIAQFNRRINRDLETRGLRKSLRARRDEAKRCYEKFGWLANWAAADELLERVRDLESQLAELDS